MLFFYGMRRYGKKNATTRSGVCASCGSAGTLESYETAKFLHLYWLPLIPIGHDRIIDACPHCKACRTISPRQYNRLKQQNEETLLGQLRTNPEDPDLVCKVLGHWASYNDSANFERVASIYQSRMQTNTRVLSSIAHGYYHLGCFSKALEVAKHLPDSDPDKKDLVEMARAHIEVESRETGNASKPAGVPIFLPYLVPLLIILSVLGSFIGKGVATGRAREVWLVNGSQRTYTVRIDETRYELGSYAKRPVTIPMGRHEVQIEDTPIECEPFSIEYDLPFNKRIGDDNLLVLNPDGLAFLVLAQIPYIADGSSRTAEPRYEYLFGKKWHVLDKVDYAFCETPQNIDIPSGQSITYKSQLTQYEPAAYSDLFNALLEHTDVEDFKPFSEEILRLQPDTIDTGWMLGVALGTDDITALKVLDEGLAVRPVLVEWHRFYQSYKEQKEPDYDLVTEYQALLDAEPDEPALQYLRGRVEPDSDRALNYFTASEEGKGCGGYGYNAVAYEYMCRLQFTEALAYARKALEKADSANRFQNLYSSACLANREYQPLIDLIRKQKVDDPDNGELVALEIRYLQLMGQEDEALRAESTYLRSTADWMEHDTRKGWENYFAAARCYADGELESYLSTLEAVIPDQASYRKALHEGNTQGAFEVALADESADFTAFLVIYGTAMKHGQEDIANRTLQKAFELLETRPDVKKYLNGVSQQSPDVVAMAKLLPEEKLVVASTLGYLHPNQQKEYFQVAETCNYSPFFPQLLVKSWLTPPLN